MKGKACVLGGNMFEKIKNFASSHADEALKLLPYVALAGGALLLYWKSFDYGYDCRVNLEKAAGEDIFNAVENQN